MRNYSLSYVARRVCGAILTLWIALTINFLLPRLMGGNPVDYIASQSATGSLEYAQILTQQFGLDKGMLEQYFCYLGQLLQGNMGISYSTFPVPVWDIISRAIPWTLLIVISSTLISFAFAWVLGTFTALKKGSAFDNVTVGISFYLQSSPQFFVGMMILIGLGYYLNLFPMGHAMSSGLAPGMPWYQTLADVCYHAFLPVLSMILVNLAGRLVMMRSNILQIFSEDYITLAQAKGLRRRTVLSKYALRNALLPSFTGLMISLGAAVGGAITIEIIYAYPGIGLTIINAIHSQDYPLIQGCFAIIAVSVVLMNLLADLIYPLLDPRITLK